MKRNTGLLPLTALLLAAAMVAVLVGEAPLGAADYLSALIHPGSAPGEILWTIRAPRAALAARFREPETLILLGVSISAFAGALSSLVYNLSPSPVTTAEVLSWMLGSVANRDWPDVVTTAIPAAIGALLVAWSARGLTMLTLGEETAALSGLPMTRLRAAAVGGAALLAGAAVAAAGIIGFVGLAAPHLVRRFAGDDPGRTLLPSALAGAVLLVLADLAARTIPTEQELKLGVVTALFGAPLFALVAWRAARSWRS